MLPRLSLKLTLLLAVPLVVMGAATNVHVPTKTHIKVFLKDTVSSAQSHVGDRVHLVVAEDVVAGGYVVFSKGDDGLATVDQVSPGVVHVIFNWVHAVDGSKIGVVGDVAKAEAATSGGNSNAGVGAGDIRDGLYRANNVASNADAPQQVQGALGRVSGTFGSLLGNAPAPKATAAPTNPSVVPVTLLVKNPDGVTVAATRKSDDDDTDVK